MSYQVLARKWRPKKFEDVIGQSHVTEGLKNALNHNRLGHAYLMTGTRGVGKTSVARIFAKALRCNNRTSDGNPCNQCQSCIEIDDGSSIDVLELDAASNNSVDDIRQIVENVQYLPSSGKYKVYIIDEVHMLSVNAFNALLKTLEEPPEHVIFVMATTEAQKLLGTVLSRCQRFDFRHASSQDLKNHVLKLSKEENFQFEDERLVDYVVKLARGSFRDALSLLDQVLSFSKDGNIDEETVVYALGMARLSAIKVLLESILIGDHQSISKKFRSILAENVSVENIFLSLLDLLFDVIEAIDLPNVLSTLIDNKKLEDIEASELFWIYEVLSKDSSWVLHSLCPDSSAILVLKKVALRREFFTKKIEGQRKTIVKKEEKVADFSEIRKELDKVSLEQKETKQVPVQEQKEAPQKESKSWEMFLNFLMKISPAMASNLEQGNIIGELDLQAPILELKLGFSSSSKLFYDYLSEKGVYDRLKTQAAQYFEKDKDKIQLVLKLEGNEFLSLADLHKKEILESKKLKEENLRGHPMVLKAQEMFNSQLDKVSISD
ncbi:MAG: DNA polymerase III subunit gamma/tau [Halobacteriovoraceae bacterium]|nr:DNA polymerase III subunit gamma/tau [Halobacteriovoraceae bacterium]